MSSAPSEGAPDVAPAAPSVGAVVPAGWVLRSGRVAEAVAVPLVGLAVAASLFGLFVLAAGASPFETYYLIWRGAFGTSFSWANTLQKAAPLLLVGLTTALPAWLGLMIIGAEGALVLGGLAAAAVGPALTGANPWLVDLAMLAAGTTIGAIWIAIPGALRHWRGINETISSLLLNYIALALMNQIVEGPLRDPASLNKPSTTPLDPSVMIGRMPWVSVHWGLFFGVVSCLVTWVLMSKTTFGFAARVAGGNPRAAQMAGLSIGRLVLSVCAMGGAAAGLAGAVEVAAVQGSASATLASGYGYTGILVAFLARQNPLAIIPVALLLGGIEASNGLLQRHLDLPDATVKVLQGIVFVCVLAAETLAGRIPLPGLKRHA